MTERSHGVDTAGAIEREARNELIPQIRVERGAGADELAHGAVLVDAERLTAILVVVVRVRRLPCRPQHVFEQCRRRLEWSPPPRLVDVERVGYRELVVVLAVLDVVPDVDDLEVAHAVADVPDVDAGDVRVETAPWVEHLDGLLAVVVDERPLVGELAHVRGGLVASRREHAPLLRLGLEVQPAGVGILEDGLEAHVRAQE